MHACMQGQDIRERCLSQRSSLRIIYALLGELGVHSALAVYVFCV